MTRIVLTAQVENPKTWEQQFQTHADLFRQMGFAKAYDYSIGKDSDVAVSVEVDDVDGFLQALESPENVAAMENDGVRRDTVHVFVLDKSLRL